MKRLKKLSILLFTALLVSCSFVTDDEGEHEKAVLPDIILENSTYTLGQSGESPVYIESTEMTFYSKDNRATVENISFISYDEEGNPSVEGNAGHAEINTETKTMNLSGNVRLRSSSGDMMIEAENLIFDSENNEIEADGDVSVSSEDGTFRGSGFRGDLREEAYSFQVITEGIFEL